MKKNTKKSFLHESGILYKLEKPSRYIGGEYNSIRKNWDKTHLKTLLVFPDIYDIGMSHLGLKVLYEIINKREDLLAERSYLPWIDLMEIMEKTGEKPFSQESLRVPKSFDIVGFTLQYELSFPSVIKYLKLSGINPWSQKRNEDDPLIIAGGPCAYNPEPLAPFIDAFLIGDAEEAILEMIDSVKATKSLPKEQTLLELAKIKGVYVPRFYEESEGEIKPKKEYSEHVFKKIEKRVAELSLDNTPLKQIIPFTQTVHDRAVIEVMRGCTRGCRFCHAGIVYRPARERSKEDVLESCERILSNTGYEELSLLSLSTLDHSQISQITDSIVPQLKEEMISLSIPSSRLDKFGFEIADKISSLRKTGLTVAPEAGTQKMRDRINKNINDEDIFNMLEAAKSKGWKRVKLYFMAGLPFETASDLQGMIDTVKRIKQTGMKKISVSVAGFIPKPHTPFQYAAQDSIDELHSKIRKLAVLKKTAQFECHKPEISFVEGVLARGDRKLAPVIEFVSDNGGCLDAWKDRFSFERWQRAFKEHDIVPENYIRARGFKEKLPWDHIDTGIRKEFLIDEYKKTFSQELTQDCRSGSCCMCGVCFDLNDTKNKSYDKKQGVKVVDKEA